MRFRKPRILVSMLLGTLMVWVAAPAPIRAQVTTATIYGTVVDSSGARIPGVTVNLTQQETSTVTTKITTETGDFQFDFVRAGTYTISMELAGFKTYKESGISLGAGQSVRRTYTLEVGQSSETVSVEASLQLRNLDRPEQTSVIADVCADFAAKYPIGPASVHQNHRQEHECSDQ